MIEVTREEFNRIRPMRNKILIKMLKNSKQKDQGFDSVKMIQGPDGDIKIELDNTFDPTWMLAIRGVVVKNPPYLYFNDVSNMDGSLLWDTDIETQVGDTVYVDYISIQKAFGISNQPEVGNYFSCEEDVYVLLDYSMLYIALREGDIFPLNGWVVGKPTKESIETSLIVPDSVKSKSHDYKFHVMYTGTPNRAYKHMTAKAIAKRGVNADTVYDFKHPIKGKDVLFKIKNNTIALENDVNPTLEPGLRVGQRRYITAVFE
jgi:hypothetical protein